MSIFDDMTNDQFRDAVAEAYKAKQLRPAWWLRLLKPDMIDRTEEAVGALMVEVGAQADRGSVPAATFRMKLNGALAQIHLQRALDEDAET